MKSIQVLSLCLSILLSTGFTTIRANGAEGEGYQLDNPVTVRYLKRNLAKGSPRLVLNRETSDLMMRKMKTDPKVAGFYRILKSEAEAISDLPLLERVMTGRRMSTGYTRLRLATLGMVYYIDRDPAILQRLDQELLAVCGFTDWNPSHYLDAAGTALSVALAIDWAGEDLPSTTVDIAKEALIEKGILPSFDGEDYNWWINCHHNWNQVCHAGMVAAAIVIAEKDPELAAKTIHRALENIPLAMDAYGPDGIYPEGASYWGFGTSHTIITVAMFQSAFGTDFGISDYPGFMESATFVPMLTAPTGEFYNFYDCGSNLTDDGRGYGDASVAMFNRSTSAVNLLWFAGRTGNAFFYDASYFSDTGKERRFHYFDAPALVWLAQLNTSKETGLKGVWKGDGPNPLLIFRDDGPNMYYLGAKGGKAINNHGNMDAGSFIFELNGVRWSIDPGNQSYHALEKTGFDLWNNKQDSERWTLLTKNNFGHSTLTINNQLHKASGMSILTDFQEGEKPRATFDLSDPLEGQLKSASRTFIKDSPTSLITEDRIVLSDDTEMITWQMMTTAEVQLMPGGAMLLQDGKKLKLENLSHPEVHVSVVSLDPAPLELDKPIPGMKRLEIRIPTWSFEGDEGLIRVRLSDPRDPAVIDPTLTPREDQRLHEQAVYMLRFADSVLSAHPPRLPEPLERKLALYILDCIFHDVYAPDRPPVQEYVQKRLETAAAEIESTEVDEGAVIWKIYSHSFVVKTPEVCIAMDLVRPSVRFENFYLDNEPAMERIIRQCDVLFISHWHPDHADEWVANLFLGQDKPVIAPPDVWKDEPFYERLLHPERDPDIRHKISLGNGKKGIEAVIHPGHQSDYLNNLPVIYTPDGICFSHTGDQNYGQMAKDTLWIKEIAERHEIDFLLYNPYMSAHWIRWFDPELVVSAHENELGHGIRSRHPFWKMHQRAETIIKPPVMVLSWGESYHYKPEKP